MSNTKEAKVQRIAKLVKNTYFYRRNRKGYLPGPTDPKGSPQDPLTLEAIPQKMIRKYKNMIINNNKRRRKEQNKERPFLSNIFVILSHIKNKMMEPLSINEY